MPGPKWTKKENAVMRRRYADVDTATLAKELNRTERAVYMQAIALGLKKSAAHIAKMQALVMDKLVVNGVANRFKPGQEPANKGRRMVEWMSAEGIKRTSATRFVKGAPSINRVEIGTERVNKDGCVEIKVGEPRKWMLKHRHEWVKVHGPIPEGMILVCRGDDRTNCRPENWELITRVENMQRNSYHRYGPEIAGVYQAIGVLNRQINKLTKKTGDERH